MNDLRHTELTKAAAVIVVIAFAQRFVELIVCDRRGIGVESIPLALGCEQTEAVCDAERITYSADEILCQLFAAEIARYAAPAKKAYPRRAVLFCIEHPDDIACPVAVKSAARSHDELVFAAFQTVGCEYPPVGYP